MSSKLLRPAGGSPAVAQRPQLRRDPGPEERQICEESHGLRAGVAGVGACRYSVGRGRRSKPGVDLPPGKGVHQSSSAVSSAGSRLLATSRQLAPTVAPGEAPQQSQGSRQLSQDQRASCTGQSPGTCRGRLVGGGAMAAAPVKLECTSAVPYPGVNAHPSRRRRCPHSQPGHRCRWPCWWALPGSRRARGQTS